MSGNLRSSYSLDILTALQMWTCIFRDELKNRKQIIHFVLDYTATQIAAGITGQQLGFPCRSVFRLSNIINDYSIAPLCHAVCIVSILAQSYSCVEPSLVFAAGPTSTHQRVTWLVLYRKLIGSLHIVVWQMRVSTRLLEVTWLECVQCW